MIVFSEKKTRKSTLFDKERNQSLQYRDIANDSSITTLFSQPITDTVLAISFISTELRIHQSGRLKSTNESNSVVRRVPKPM